MQQPIVAVYLLWLMWSLSWLGAALLANKTKMLSIAQDVLYRTLIIVGGVMLLFGFLPDPGFDVRNKFWLPLSGIAGWLLVAVLFLAICFAWWARICRGFHLPGSTKKRAPFTEAGPYKWVRHPIYVSLVVGAIATGLVFGRPSSLGGAGLLAIAFLFKILIEESVLRGEYGSFDDYADRVPMLLPFRRAKGERYASQVAPPPSHAFRETAEPVRDPLPPTLAAAPIPAADPQRTTPVSVAGSQLSLPLAPPPAGEPAGSEPATAEDDAHPALSDAMPIMKR